MAVTGIHGGSRSGEVWSYDWCAKTIPAFAPAHNTSPFWPLLLWCCSSQGGMYHAERVEDENLRNGTSSDLTLRASAPAPWDATPLPNSVVTATEHRRNPGSHLGLAVATLSPSPPPPHHHKGDSCKHNPGKNVTHVHFKSSSPTKVIGHKQTA